MFLGFDFVSALTPDVSLLETVVRGAAMYLLIFVLLRVVLRGRTGSETMSDILVLVLIADAAQNAMSADYGSITNGAVLVATIVGMSALMDLLAYRVPALQAFIHPQRRPLVINGRVVRKNLASEMMTEEELMTQLRLQGVEAVSKVRAAYLEGNGEISVIKRTGAGRSEG